MNTAKNFQLLDDNNNNISPITNIESLYYEVNEGGVIYRNALYQHFPVYVKYNNNIDAPIDAGSLKAYIDNNIYKNTDSSFYKSPNVLLKEQSNPTAPGADILVTAIRQSRLANTRYHKLDISTYNLTSILNLYAPKQYVVDAITTLTEKTDHVKYKSNIAAKYSSGQLKTLYDIGSYPKGTSIGELNNKDINDIIDNAFFKEVTPNIINTSVNLLQKTPIYIELKPSNISTLSNTQNWKQLVYNTIKNFLVKNYIPSNPEFSLVYKLPGQNDTLSANGYFDIKIDAENDQKLKDDILINGSSVTPQIQKAYLDIVPLKITTNTTWTGSNLTPVVKTNWGKPVSAESAYNIIRNTPIDVIEPIYINNELIYKDKELYMTLPPFTDTVTSYNNTVYLKQLIAKKYNCAYISYNRKMLNYSNIFSGNTMQKEIFDNLWNNTNTSLIHFDIMTDIQGTDIEIEHACYDNILAVFIPAIKNSYDIEEYVKITHIIHEDQKLPITYTNQFYKWTKIMSIAGVDNYKILLLDTMLAGNNKFILHIDTYNIM